MIHYLVGLLSEYVKGLALQDNKDIADFDREDPEETEAEKLRRVLGRGILLSMAEGVRSLELRGLDRNATKFELGLGLTEPDGWTICPKSRELEANQIHCLNAGHNLQTCGSRWN